MARSLLPRSWQEEAHPLQFLRREVDDLFSDWVGEFNLIDRPRGLTEFWPRVNVSETENELQVTADLPGIDEKDLDVTVAGNQLVLKGEKKSESEEKKEEKGRAFHRVERSYGSFLRTLTLPFDIDPEKVDASFNNGVLTLTLAKPQEIQQKSRRIEVKGEKSEGKKTA